MTRFAMTPARNPWSFALRLRCALAAGLVAGATAAGAQEGLRLTLQPSDLVVVPAPTPRALDLTVHWTPEHEPGHAIDLIAGRQMRGLGLHPNASMPGFVPARPEPVSLRELTFIGVQFQGGSRLTLRRKGDGLGLTYRTTF
ncbi:hypothetical protein ACT80S_19005 [Ramlibacter sp. MAHUQ-53]|uniref:hypothetical protein n=1 Tax=unclassified Ramlibacter TaxID=2617605 RepID=UPI003635D4F4